MSVSSSVSGRPFVRRWVAVVAAVVLLVAGLVSLGVPSRAVGRTRLERMSAAWRAGREIKFSTFPVTLLRDGETPELVFAVEEAFTKRSTRSWTQQPHVP